MAKRQETIIRYSICFKQKVVKELEEEGMSYEAMRRRYGIKGGSTIQNWVKKFGKNHLINKIVRVEMKGEKDRIKELETELKEVKLAYADVSMQRDVLETLVEVVNEHYQTDVKKNFGQKSSKAAMQSKAMK
jgi:transposase-like protein